MAQVLAGAKIRRVNQSTAALYQKLMADRKLRITQENKTIIQGVLDLFNKRLQKGTIPQLQQRYGSLDEETNEEEVRELFNSLFAASQADPEAHFRLVAAVYITELRELFWNIYWEQFKVCLLEEKRIADIVVTLDMWFKASGYLVEQYPYVFPEFFTQLPKFLEELKASKNYKVVQKEFEKRLSQKDWYPVIQKYIQSRQNLLSNIWGAVNKL
ncbi:MAG: hypothetical protein GDA44_04870 [Prochloron sp. SP5CPC1]|nr:hypothetical protein [Candidatus Paraprochloron terpiosi SP5CPC1]